MNPDDLKRIQANVAAMRAKGAPESDVLAYLQMEDSRLKGGGTPSTPVPVAAGMARSFARGATLGWEPQIAGAIDQGAYDLGLARLNPLLAKLHIAPIVPGDQETARIQAAQQAFHQQDPKTDVATQLAGAVASPVNKLLPGVGEGTTPAAVAGRGAVSGGILGAVNGAGEAQPGHRLAGAVIGGLLGTAGGAILPAAIAEGRALLNPLRPAMSRIASTVDIPALRAELARLASLGKGDVTALADLSPQTRALADQAATASPAAAEQIAGTSLGRQADQSQRVLQNVRDGLGGDEPSLAASMEDLVAQRRQWAAGPSGFQGLRDMNMRFTPDQVQAIAPTLNQPVVRSALKSALETGLIGTDRPSTFQALQDVKESLDDAVTRAFRNGDGNLGTRLTQARDQIRDFLVKNVPDYSTVSAEYARRVGLENALQAGADAWNKSDVQGLTRQIAKLAPEQLQQFRTGMAAKLVDQLSASATNRDVAAQLANAGRAEQQKLQVVFGDQDTFDRFMQQMKAERQLAQLRSTTGGSQTATRLASSANALMHGGVGYAAAFHPTALPAYLGFAGLRAAIAKAGAAQATQMAPMLTTQGTDAISQLLDKLASNQAAPLVGPLASQVPALAGRAGGLLSAQ